MDADKLDLLGPIYADIGREAVRLTEGEPNGVFLYVEAGDNWVETSLYKDDGKSLTFISGRHSTILSDLLMEVWDLEPADKRWTTMQYTIDHGKFSANFGFEDLERSEEDGGDRRERILRARYGDKPVIYPPLTQDAWALKPRE